MKARQSSEQAGKTMSERTQGPPERRSSSPDNTEVAKAMPAQNAVKMFLMLRTLRFKVTKHKTPYLQNNTLRVHQG